MRITRKFIACTAIVTALISSTAFSSVLSTRDQWNGVNNDSTTNHNLIAQSFDLPDSSTELTLDSFTMVMRTNMVSTTMHGVFLELDGSNSILSRTNLGSVVVTPVSPIPLANDFQNVTFNVGQTLDVTKRYATAFWSDNFASWADLGLNTSHSNPVFLNHMFWSNELASVGGPTVVWGGDAVVDLNFSSAAAVSEPITLALMGLGIASIGFSRRKAK